MSIFVINHESVIIRTNCRVALRAEPPIRRIWNVRPSFRLGCAGEFGAGLVAAGKHQNAPDQRQNGEHQKTRRGAPGRFLDPADQIRAAEPARLPIELISAMAPAAAVPESQAVGKVQNTAKMQKMPIAANVSATMVAVGSVR
jgi:hypothetical protein